MQTQHIQQNLLSWFDQFGRKDLPWQQNKSGYSVWVSEIMLQQTQVNTVIPYFLRFMAKFPTLASLAAANQEEVLHLWTGLGYYARGRNLHNAAQKIQADLGGEFPESMAQLLELPGIGRSTAAAILSLSFEQHHAILDGNVKRIISRLFRVKGWSGSPEVVKQFWQFADMITPRDRCADFNQALMDLGSSLCSRSKPQCELCPLNKICEAFQTGQTEQYPKSKPKKTLPERESFFLIIISPDREVLLEKRLSKGIWGGLWAFPQFTDLNEIPPWLDHHQLQVASKITPWHPFRHTFTHFHLQIKPVQVVIAQPLKVFDSGRYCWYRHDKKLALGLPAPIVALLQQFNAMNEQ